MKYPEITYLNLVPIMMALQHMEDDSGYLGRDCPYDDMTKEALISLKPKKIVVEREETDEIDLFEEVRRTYEDLKNFDETEESMSTADRMAVFRVKTTNLAKLIDLMERARGLKRVQEFISIIMEVAESLDVPERAELVTKLKERLTA